MPGSLPPGRSAPACKKKCIMTAWMGVYPVHVMLCVVVAGHVSSGSDPHVFSHTRSLPGARTMQQFDRDAAASDQLCIKGDIVQAIELGVTACHHGKEKHDAPEASSLRDARADLLKRCILLAQTTSRDEDVDARLHALLERRIFNWLCKSHLLKVFLQS
jgi:hypothetical protein